MYAGHWSGDCYGHWSGDFVGRALVWGLHWALAYREASAVAAVLGMRLTSLSLLMWVLQEASLDSRACDNSSNSNEHLFN